MPQSAVAWSDPTLEPDVLSDSNFDRVAELIQAYSGIRMPGGKQVMLAGRLRRRLASLQIDSLDAYCDYVFEGGGQQDEIIHLIDAVTTNKTDFFREPAHFEFMHKVALPALAEEGRRDVKIWSAAASIGAEAYTLAMVMEEFRRGRPGIGYSILATDICTEVLNVALAGRFSTAMIEPVPLELRRRYVLESRKPKVDEVRIVPQLRAKIAFARLNLMDDAYPVGHEMDFIFCRNILIYFDKENQAKVLSRLCRHLRPGGYLVLGHSESLLGADLPVKHLVNTIFQRR
jgi:chemotaxis protein methyltransferase CheR